MEAAAASTFKRKMPPLPVAVVMGAWMHGVGAPAVWALEKFGFAERVFGFASGLRRKRAITRNPFANYVPADYDVFVATYAKSGTNWIMQIAHQLIWHGKGEFDHIHNVVPWPDMYRLKYAVPLEEADIWKTAPERKRVIKTHLDWELLPYSEAARYIMVIRDPKDVFVSSYFFIRDSIMGPAMPSVDSWRRLFLSPNFFLGGSWARNTAGYWAQRAKPNVLILSFKSMKRDLRGTVRQVADFLNVRVSEAVIDEVCRKSSFEYMKQIDKKFHMGRIIPWMKDGVMMRKGKEGGSSELLSKERQMEIDAHFMAELKRLGADFPYEEFCTLAP